MFTLSNFYTSKEWRDLRSFLMSERTNEKGQIICAHCGLPVVKKGDCIGNHIIELTEENVNDYDISLNPDNVELIHFNCHNIHHRRFGHDNKKKVFIVYGAPLSGKTSLVKQMASANDIIVDIDSIYECFSMNARYKKNKRISSFMFDIQEYAYELIKRRKGKWENAFIIAGLPQSTQRNYLKESLNAELIFCEASKEECIQRLNEDTERDIEAWIEYINDWFERYS